MEIYDAIKRAEQDRFYAQVTELDFDWYLRTA
jgi:glutamine synthetase